MASVHLEEHTLSGRYKIESLIGQGGMAAVYKAYDPNLRRTVAIKIIHPHLSNNAEFIRRFEEEATAIAHLRHPNIVQVFDFNHDGDLFYMVMEYILGETLQNRLKRLAESRRRLPVKDVAQFSVDICEAAEYAHERGMIHRDIKPANVMLDVNGKAILMDFGIARIVGGHQHTATGAVLGTAMYMAPEQIRGLHADARADLYSIGVTLFEMLAGKPPFEADSAMTLMMMHLNDPLPDLCELQPDTPAGVAAVVARAMAKDREQRYQTAAQMANDLRQLQNGGLPITAGTGAAAQPPRSQAASATMVEAAALSGSGVAAPATDLPGATIIEPAPGGAASQTIIEQAAPAALRQSSAAPAAFPATPELAGYPVRRKSSRLGVVIAMILVLAGLGAAGFFAYQRFIVGTPPPAVSALPSPTAIVPAVVLPVDTAATATTTATATPQPTATPTPEPSLTPTETAIPTPLPVAIGGADKIAYLSGSDIWLANLDGSQLTQLTQDGTQKNYLRWLPDGQGLTYISGKCIQIVSLAGEIQVLTCFNNSEYLESFEVSPDGEQVVIGVDRQLYLLPFDLAGLAEADTHDDLASMASCAGLAPYTRNFGHSVRWSKDGSRWAALIIGVLKDGRRGDLVQVFAVDRCIPNPLVEIQFPPPHFTYGEYENTPVLESIAWDGDALFSFHGNTRNEGFGNLHLFNMETYRFDAVINPVNGTCCYRDPQWSPDGTHLLFAYQDYLQGSSSTTQLYYIPYGSLGTGTVYEPLPLPEITDPREKPQPVLRPALAP